MHCHLPSLQSVIVALVRVKGGDLTDVNNYQTLSPKYWKVFSCTKLSLLMLVIIVNLVFNLATLLGFALKP